MKSIPVKRSRGNVFADLKLPDPDTHLLKAHMVSTIAALIRDQRLTQTAAARKLGLKQPDVSRLLDGRFDGFSLERLLGLLVALGQVVTFDTEPANENHAPGLRLLEHA